MSTRSAEAAQHAAGALVAGVDAVMKGKARTAFAAVRPPGHHAPPTVPGGFCLFNNVAVGALHAQAVYGLERVAIIDFDVHHGQGTQAVVEPDPPLFYASTHQYAALSRHRLAARARHRRQCRERAAVPPAAAAPSSAPPGASASCRRSTLSRPACHRVGGLRRPSPTIRWRSSNVETDDFVWLTEELLAIADRHAKGRLVSALEGGYDLDALAESVVAHVQALMRAG